jgi:hypothetical protein
MEKSLQDKFENINLDEIPDSLRFELETIQEETDNFKDEDATEIFQKNFNYLYFTIGKKYPTALKDYTPPAPTAEELEVKRKRDEFDSFINSGNDKIEAKDFDGALADFNHALSLGVDNEIASNKISGTERLKADVEAERVKQEKLAKVKELADKYKKKETA